MTLSSIAFANLRRRKARAAFLIAGLLIGVGTVVALVTLTRSMTGEAEANLRSYGANIVVAPKSKDVSLTYGGIDVGGVSVGSQSLTGADLERVRAIPARASISVVAPELVGAVQVKGHRALLMGVDPAAQFKLKRWWSVDAGRPPRNGHELVAGAKAAQVLGLQMGDYVRIAASASRSPGSCVRPAPRTMTCSSPIWGPSRGCSAGPASSRSSRWRPRTRAPPSIRSCASCRPRFPAPKSRPSARRCRAACTRSTSSRASVSRSSASSSASRSSWCSSP